MKQGLFLISFILITIVQSNSQETVNLYYNSKWELTDSINMEYYRIVQINSESLLFHGWVKDYYKNDTLCMTGYYHKGNKVGPFVFYDKVGLIERKGEYQGKNRVKLWEYYYPNSLLKQKIDFKAVMDNDDLNYDFSVLQYFDVDGNQVVKDGSGTWTNNYTKHHIRQYYVKENGIVTYHEDPIEWLITISGDFLDRKKHGCWSESAEGRPTLVECFKNGKIYRKYMSTDHYGIHNVNNNAKYESLDKIPDDMEDKFQSTDKWRLDTNVFNSNLFYHDTESILSLITGKEFKIQERSAGYPDGDYDLSLFISNNINYPLKYRQQGIGGTVLVEVTINENGIATDYNILEGINKTLNEEAVRVLGLVDKWLPALHKGKPVISKINVPVTFKTL